jgi:SagB-type dehydrogenase family enzyme
MNGLTERISLAAQEHPAGRVDLTGTTSYLTEFRRRGFSDGDISDLFHENTKFDRRYLDRSTLTENELPNGFSTVEQDYHDRETVPLPEPEPVECGLETALGDRRSARTFLDRGVTKRTLGTLLGHAVEPTAERDTGVVSETSHPYPSAGGLYPVEVYPVVTDGVDLDAGTYYYSPREHALRLLETGRASEGVADCFMEAPFSEAIVADAPMTIVLTGCLSRISAKYGPVGYRFVLFEAGHLAQNLLLTATALGLGGVPLGSFLDDDLDRFLGVDGTNEAALYPVALGHPRDND